jgi:putative polyketide hydroxylase
MIEIPVLIVVGGPVGLTASLLLSRQGVRLLLVERHPGTAILPKARGINASTMEMYRQLGIEAAIRKAGLAPERTGLIVWTESLAGSEIERRVPGRMAPANRAASPVPNCLRPERSGTGAAPFRRGASAGAADRGDSGRLATAGD